MNRFHCLDTPLDGLKVVQRSPHRDGRGYLAPLFCAKELSQAGWQNPVAQINHTLTHQSGVVRGMHFQRAPHAETKLVSCLRGEVWDVAIDLRSGSPTFLRWHAQRLSAGNGRALLIPRGFAHGFQTLTSDCELMYLHDAAYEPTSEAGVNALDPRVNIDWPLAIGEMSERDRHHPMLTEEFEGLLE